MSDLRILVVDDRQNWQEQLRESLERIGSNIKVNIAANYDEAYNAIYKEEYALITMDIALNGQAEIHPMEDADRLGMELLKLIRTSPKNKNCSVILITGIATPLLFNEVLSHYDQYRIKGFIEKDKFQLQSLEDLARTAIRNALLEIAEIRMSEQLRVIVTFDDTHLISCDLLGTYQLHQPVSGLSELNGFNMSNLSNRADNINILISQNNPDIWRNDLRTLGTDLYAVLMKEPGVQRCLTIAETLAQQSGKNLWLQFQGPAKGLSVPFELLHDGNTYLSLHHVVTRRLQQNKPTFSPKALPFHKFIRQIIERGDELRILLVGSSYDDTIPEAEQEVKELHRSIEKNLQRIGIKARIDSLYGKEVNGVELRNALRNGHYHIFHYAGHGRYRDTLPETSNLALQDNSLLTASTLNTLVRNTDLYMVFLSSCLSARNATQTKRGDFHGILDALVSANVPIVLGYRWTVRDSSSFQLAKNFYETLWNTFSPGDALLEARIQATMGELERDDETWASLVMVMQSA